MPKKQANNHKEEKEPLQELKELYQFMQDNSLAALELDKKDFHIRLVRQGRATVPVPVPVPIGTAQTPSPAMACALSPAAAALSKATTLPPNAAVVKSPMMGIFYRASSPSSPPFVKEGDRVKAGDVICLIEAMKVFNDVKTEVSGTIVSVCLENGKSVKVGQELFILERSS